MIYLKHFGLTKETQKFDNLDVCSTLHFTENQGNPYPIPYQAIDQLSSVTFLQGVSE